MAASASAGRPQFISSSGGNRSFSNSPLIENSDSNQIIVPEVWFSSWIYNPLFNLISRFSLNMDFSMTKICLWIWLWKSVLSFKNSHLSAWFVINRVNQNYEQNPSQEIAVVNINTENIDFVYLDCFIK